jgi:hypothetical protein
MSKIDRRGMPYGALSQKFALGCGPTIIVMRIHSGGKSNVPSMHPLQMARLEPRAIGKALKAGKTNGALIFLQKGANKLGETMLPPCAAKPDAAFWPLLKELITILVVTTGVE